MDKLLFLTGCHFKGYNKNLADAVQNNDIAIVYQYILDFAYNNKIDCNNLLKFSIVEICEECNVWESDLSSIFYRLKTENLIYDYEISSFKDLVTCKINLTGLYKIMGLV